MGSNIDIHQQLWPLTASYLAMFKVTSIYRLLQPSTDFYRLLQTSTDFYRQRQSEYLRTNFWACFNALVRVFAQIYANTWQGG